MSAGRVSLNIAWDSVSARSVANLSQSFGPVSRRRVSPLPALAVLIYSTAIGCTCQPEPEQEAAATVPAIPAEPEAGPRPQVLYLPDAAPAAPLPRPQQGLVRSGRCSHEMVDVAGRFCIDRYEASLVDLERERRVSPYYYPSLNRTKSTFEAWETLRFTMGDEHYQTLSLPAPPAFQLSAPFRVKAVSQPGVVPNGYLSGLIAGEACRNAGKRLCTEEEWVLACRGQSDQRFPYGDVYEPGRCNVHRDVHPARILHGHASLGHLDPRLNHFAYQGRALLHSTGSNQDCASRWGSDAVYDMVGNLDEWIDDEQGAFLGGFYSRGTKEGCQSKITAHPQAYYDYSLGVRCCR